MTERGVSQILSRLEGKGFISKASGCGRGHVTGYRINGVDKIPVNPEPQTVNVQTPFAQTPFVQTVNAQTPFAQTPFAQTMNTETPFVQRMNVNTLNPERENRNPERKRLNPAQPAYRNKERAEEPIKEPIEEPNTVRGNRNPAQPCIETEPETVIPVSVEEVLDMDNQVILILQEHPANAHLKLGTIDFPMVDVGACGRAIERDGFDLVLIGTRNYREAVKDWPLEGRAKAVMRPARFYNEQHYRRDPAEWRRDVENTSKPKSFDQQRWENTDKAIVESFGNHTREGVAPDFPPKPQRLVR
jgi:hypothetical protein